MGALKPSRQGSHWFRPFSVPEQKEVRSVSIVIFISSYTCTLYNLNTRVFEYIRITMHWIEYLIPKGYLYTNTMLLEVFVKRYSK